MDLLQRAVATKLQNYGISVQGEWVRSFLGHQLSIFDLEFSRDGKLLLTGNGTAKVWEVITGKEILSVTTGSERVTNIAFDPKRKFFVTVGFKRGVVVWEYPSKKSSKNLRQRIRRLRRSLTHCR
ncbi:MAG: WD40 repeat domain-containing protein [Cytophagales bacterium]